MSNILEVFGRGLVRNLDERLSIDDQFDTRAGAAAAPSARRPILQEAIQHYRRQQWCDALSTCERIAGDNDEVVLCVAASCCDQLGRRDDANEWLRRAASVATNNASIHLALGQNYECDGHLDAARNAYATALDIDPTSLDAHARLAAMDVANGGFTSATRGYEEISAVAPHRTELGLALAHLHIYEGDADAAIDGFERAITIEPDTWDIDDDIAAALESGANMERAIVRLESRIEHEPGFADTHLRLGDLYAKVGRSDAALRQYLMAVELHPEYLEASVKIGTHFLRHGRYYECADWFNRGIRINDRLLSAYCGLAYAHLIAGHDAGVSSSLDLAAAIAPNSTLLLTEVARLERRIDAMHDEAYDDVSANASERMDYFIDEQIQRLTKSAIKRPNHAELHYNLGVLHRQRGRIEAAVRHLRRAATVNPAHAKAQLLLAVIVHERGRATTARQHLTNAFRIKVQELPTYYALALLATDTCRFRSSAVRYGKTLPDNAGPLDFAANVDVVLRLMRCDWHLQDANPFQGWNVSGDLSIGSSRIV